MKTFLFAVLMIIAAAVSPAAAVNPDEMLADPILEERARDISTGLRCLVCQNESIDESNAELAADLRILVRERLAAGDSDKQVVQYIVDRYGDYVLLEPPFKVGTLALWLAGPVLLLIGAAVLFGFYLSPDAQAAAPLSEADEARVRRLLTEGPDR